MTLFSPSCKKPRLLVVQHMETAPGGHFCLSLENCGAQLTYVRPKEGDILPARAEDFEGLVVLGGPENAFNDEEGAHFPDLLQLIQLFDAQKKPVAGICLGAQLLARAHGALEMKDCPFEFGFVPQHYTPEGETDSVVGRLSLPRLMEFRQDHFYLPELATLLITGDTCPNQCFKIGHASYGFQFHLEITMDTAKNWMQKFQGGEVETYNKYLPLYDADFFADMEAGLEDLVRASNEFCAEVAARWLDLTHARCNYVVIKKTTHSAAYYKHGKR